MKGELVWNFLTKSIFITYNLQIFFFFSHKCNFYKQNFEENFLSGREKGQWVS